MNPTPGPRPRTGRRVATIFVMGLVLLAAAYYLLWTMERIHERIRADYLPPRSSPWPAYWFWTPETAKGDAWKSQARDLAARAPFDLVFATPRYPHTGVDFLDTERFLPLFTETRRILREARIGLGLDLRFYLGARGEVPAGERQQVVESVEISVDENGRGQAALPPTPALFPAIAAEREVHVLGVYPTGGDSPAPLSAERAEVRDGSVRLDIGPGPAGRKVSALVARTFNHPDLFSDAYPRAIRRVLEAYENLRPDALGLDEFAFMPLRDDRWRGALFYSEASARRFRATYDTELTDVIARMLLAPKSPARIRDAFRYHEHHRRAIAAIEVLFHVEARAKKSLFVGVHPTNQTRANYAELERALTFLDWWSVPREYGQTDEETPMAVRMALALKAAGPVWLNMYYDPDPEKILDEVAHCARFGGRVHFHAYGDAHYGYPLEKGDFLARLGAMKTRMAVLDRHVKGVPELDTLVLVGWPRIMLAAGDAYGDTMRFLNALWARGYRSAAVPTYEIADGNLDMVNGRPRYGGREFGKVIVYHPEYATKDTLAWLSRLDGVDVTIIGSLTRTSTGEELGHDERRLQHRRDWDPALASEEEVLAEPGPALHEVGVRYPANLRVFVDRKSLVDGTPAKRTLTLDGTPHPIEFTGAAVVEVLPGRPPRMLE